MNLAQIFQDTLERVAEIPQESSRKYSGGSVEVDGFVPPQDAHRTLVLIKNIDCMDEVTDLRRQHGLGTKIGLLNMANEESVGGGVVHGARAP
jgi:hypothetical protein